MQEGGVMDPQDEQKEPGAAATSPSKRALLKAVWVAPVILSVTLPRAVMAQGSIPAPPPPAPAPPPAPPP